MNSKLPRSNHGSSPAAAILTFIGMAGGVYYLYKSIIAGKAPRVADSNPDSIAKKHLEKAEANNKYQNLRRTTRIRKSTKLFDAHVKMDIENEAKKIYKRPTTFMLRNLPISLRAR